MSGIKERTNRINTSIFLVKKDGKLSLRKGRRNFILLRLYLTLNSSYNSTFFMLTNFAAFYPHTTVIAESTAPWSCIWIPVHYCIISSHLINTPKKNLMLIGYSSDFFHP